ncbi:LacI family DNA-binding transcriptional regulator [Phycisphaera mikurensis]|uniref:LacI family transcriptional regulator n=1 Tax=Phycisphaera mikurensis (strain NBRC 102666 / KCTC 22515 / FYK2301M01) TaxID=1142394 RepID=I0IFM4_PHYMF|nr:LacI family DNA-binding transcriptional regulator [Phycisphaera mikurensis]MBB6440548.1 LacI family transcriptional regulator [Phycisphaera mikurensis]BAM04062.1 LacI family transcriptional regulator [Phycisphaera mikurensis NBRC 102666]
MRNAPGTTSRKRVGIRDIAASAGVSTATVSMVLNDNPKISDATRDRVRAEIDRSGYQPNRIAQSLSGKYTRVIGILLPELRHTLADPYFGEVISGVCDRAAQLGHKVTLESARPDFIRERKHLELFERRFVDGVLCIGFDDRHNFLGDFSAAGHPMLVVNNRFDGLGEATGVVLCDYAAGAERALAYLDQLGHRRVGMVYGSRDVHTSRLLVDAFEKRHHAFDPSLLEEGRFAEDPGQAAAAALLDRHPDLTALFCGNDKMALGAVRELTDRGLRVPEDVSVIGFDDLPYARFMNPALSTVHLPFYEVGDLACERLVERIRGRKKPVDETLPTRLVIRESTGRATPRRR